MTEEASNPTSSTPPATTPPASRSPRCDGAGGIGRWTGSLSLSRKLAVVLALAAIPLVAILYLYFGPITRGSFQQHSGRLIRLGREAMASVAQGQSIDGHDVLVSLIQHSEESRRRLLSDLPLNLYRHDPDRLRQAIERADAEQSARLLSNAEVLAAEMERRALATMEESLRAITREQAEIAQSFAVEIRRSSLVVMGAALLVLIGLIGFGLYHQIIHPLRRLRAAADAIAGGNLDVTASHPARDEVGELAGAFDVMVGELRRSRADIRAKNHELEELNRGLEGEVERRTRDLRTALDDLRRTQRQLVQAEKMASIGSLAGGVAHEFNNLIGGIRGIAADALTTEDDEGKREPLEVIVRAADRASRITDALLRFSRTQVGPTEDVRVMPVLEEALRLMEPEAARCDVRVVRKIDGEDAASASIRADGQGLYQVLLNLFTNALQAMPGGGTLTVTVSSAADEIALTVKDTGPGIPPDLIDHVFEPFVSTKRDAADPQLRGSGLGLAVSYGIVQAHGGILEAASPPGEGAVFTVRFPRAPGRPGADTAIDGTERDTR